MRRLAFVIALLLVAAVVTVACDTARELGSGARNLVLPDHPCDTRLVLIDPTDSQRTLRAEVEELHRACAEAEPR